VITADTNKIEGRRYPAGRCTKGFVGEGRPITAKGFAMGLVILDPEGGQVPWHAHPNEEVYTIIEGTAQIAVGDELGSLSAGQAVYIPPNTFHQLTNLSGSPVKLLYCYSPAGDVDHWKQELAGTLPRAGIEAPALPVGAAPQRTDTEG